MDSIALSNSDGFYWQGELGSFADEPRHRRNSRLANHNRINGK